MKQGRAALLFGVVVDAIHCAPFSAAPIQTRPKSSLPSGPHQAPANACCVPTSRLDNTGVSIQYGRPVGPTRTGFPNGLNGDLEVKSTLSLVVFVTGTVVMLGALLALAL